MQKSLLLLFSVLLSLSLRAQLRNASFEQTDSLGKVDGWSVTSGKLTQLSSAQFGVIPFPPFEGNYFVLLESDTQTSTIHKGVVEQTFPLADTPGNFVFRYFYIPESINQQAAAEVLMTHWNGLSRDTVLYINKPVIAVADSNQIRIQWNQHATTLKGNYLNNILPDSATVRFVNDDGTTAGKNVRLYLDALSFGKWAVGLTQTVSTPFTVYPNPANHHIYLEGLTAPTHFTLTGMDGKQYALTAPFTTPVQSLDIRYIPNGLYILSFNTHGSMQTKRILIHHEN